MTEKELKQLITIEFDELDYITIVAKSDNKIFRMSYRWTGVEFRFLITIDKSPTRIEYSSSTIQKIFSYIVKTIKENSLLINQIIYVLNAEHAIVLCHQIEENNLVYSFVTRMETIDKLQIKFNLIKDNFSYTEVISNFAVFIEELNTTYPDLKIEIIPPSPLQLSRIKKLEKVFDK